MYTRIDANKHLTDIFNLESIRKHPFFRDAADIAGFREIGPSKKRKLYHLHDIDTKTREPIPGMQPIPELSLGYFRAWETIAFTADVLGIALMKRKNKNTYMPLSTEELSVFIDSDSIRVRDIKQFLDHGQVSRSIFDQYLPAIRSLLIEQIGKPGFDTVDDPVTQEELDIYLIQRLIDEPLHSALSKKLKEYEALKARKGVSRN